MGGYKKASGAGQKPMCMAIQVNANKNGDQQRQELVNRSSEVGVRKKTSRLKS